MLAVYKEQECQLQISEAKTGWVVFLELVFDNLNRNGYTYPGYLGNALRSPKRSWTALLVGRKVWNTLTSNNQKKWMDE